MILLTTWSTCESTWPSLLKSEFYISCSLLYGRLFNICYNTYIVRGEIHMNTSTAFIQNFPFFPFERDLPLPNLTFSLWDRTGTASTPNGVVAIRIKKVAILCMWFKQWNERPEFLAKKLSYNNNNNNSNIK